tara:strand:- start:67 stop:234 length:168 start_codon:yes stop_codon:yes gene_type:complete
MKYVLSSINTTKREDIDGTGKEKRQFRRQDTTGNNAQFPQGTEDQSHGRCIEDHI